jgi:hypothetical protein
MIIVCLTWIFSKKIIWNYYWIIFIYILVIFIWIVFCIQIIFKIWKYNIEKNV